MDSTIITLPMVPTRDIVTLPDRVVTIDVGRHKSMAAVEAAMQQDRMLVTVMQKNGDVEDPSLDDVYKEGVLCRVFNILRLPGGVLRITAQGVRTVRIGSVTNVVATNGGKDYKFPEGELSDEDKANLYYLATVETIEEPELASLRLEAYVRQIKKDLTKWCESHAVTHPDRIEKIFDMNDENIVYHVIADTHAPWSDQQALLSCRSAEERLLYICRYLDRESQLANIDNEINEKTRMELEKQQKEYFLREKIRMIRQEIGDANDPDEEGRELREALAKIENMPDKTREIMLKHINRFAAMPSMVPEAAVLRNYIETVLDLPWDNKTDDTIDITEAKKILDADHYGLEKIKNRILEFLAVRKLKSSDAGSILCFVGPPGVGKTSLATSIAKAMNRKFVRASLGGVRDEAEIRGHRRTYLGSLPGRLVQGLIQVEVNNPVFLLDEIDKLSADYKGDPSAALLEVLDPEQNATFSDHFVEIPFDFSKVFWITTANVVSNIPGPLLDRMEVIELSSYMEEEKLEIAKRYLAPKQIKKAGLSEYKPKFGVPVLKKIISEYTKEAGVRTLEKRIAQVCRKLAYAVVEDKDSGKVKDGELPKVPAVNTKNLSKYLGAPIYFESEREKTAQVGLVCGLAWTSVGGVILPCEATTMKGTGKLSLTGSLGDVMKESGQAALTYIRHNAEVLNIDPDFYKTTDIHVHCPEGATPKDGPSAGITMTLAIVSALTQRKVRQDLAMTGEVTIRGRVLPIGGLKEKLLAAVQAGVKEVLIPWENQKDIEEMPAVIKEKLLITPVRSMDEVLEKGFVK